MKPSGPSVGVRHQRVYARLRRAMPRPYTINYLAKASVFQLVFFDHREFAVR
jgi:hypothetical protein